MRFNSQPTDACALLYMYIYIYMCVCVCVSSIFLKFLSTDMIPISDRASTDSVPGDTI